MGTFNELYESAEKGELMGYVCQWHLRRDGQLTIHTLIVEPKLQRQGIGTRLLEMLERVEGAGLPGAGYRDERRNGECRAPNLLGEGQAYAGDYSQRMQDWG